MANYLRGGVCALRLVCALLRSRRVSSPMAFAIGGTLRQQRVGSTRTDNYSFSLLHAIHINLTAGVYTVLKVPAESFAVAKANSKDTLRGREN